MLGIATADLDALNRGLRPLGLGVAVPLGFHNSYALAIRDEPGVRAGIRTIGDLAVHPDLRFGLGHEFMDRNDGWPGLKRAYRLPQAPRGLDQGLAYDAIAAGQIDVIDVYVTDAKILR